MSDRTWTPPSERLKAALEHIAITCERSRQQTRRIQWIKIRAESALNGTEAWREIDLPTNGESENDRLRRENIRLKAELAEAQSQLAENAIVIADLVDLKQSMPADWRSDSSLSTWFPLTAEDFERTKKGLAEARAVFDAIASARNGGIDRLHSWLIKLPMTDAEYDLFTKAMAQKGK